MSEASKNAGMPRGGTTAQIDTAAKRAKLAPRKNPYWHGIAGGRGGVSLGYRKGRTGGIWVVKVVIDRERTEERLGEADDAGALPGTLSFPAAVAAALAWGKQQFSIAEAGREANREAMVPTVRSVVEEYATKRLKTAGQEGSEANLKSRVPADGKFGRTRLAKLTAKSIQDWLSEIQRRPKYEGQDVATLPPLGPASRNRLLGDLRAALNAAASHYRLELPGHILAEIKEGTKLEPVTDEARRQLLTDAQVHAVTKAAFEIDDDLGYLVLIAAATGARYSQIVSLRVSDVQVAKSRIMMPSSKKGRKRKFRAPAAVPVDATVLQRLAPILKGRSNAELLLLRWAYKRLANPARWEKEKRRAWGRASEVTKPWARAVELSRVPADTIMYALRHSSIVRSLIAGLPIRLVAALHDTSTIMIEKHYSAFITDMTEELARRHMIQFETAAPLVQAAE